MVYNTARAKQESWDQEGLAEDLVIFIIFFPSRKSRRILKSFKRSETKEICIVK